MSDDELEDIRKEKIEQLKAREEGDGDEPGDDEATSTPTDPIYVDGGDHLQEIVEFNDVVLVDFYADWCGPCKMLEPTVEALATESPAAVAKVDVDANQSLAAQYRVQGVPTLVLFADGEPVEQVTGVRDRQTLESLIGQHA